MEDQCLCTELHYASYSLFHKQLCILQFFSCGDKFLFKFGCSKLFRYNIMTAKHGKIRGGQGHWPKCKKSDSS